MATKFFAYFSPTARTAHATRVPADLADQLGRNKEVQMIRHVGDHFNELAMWAKGVGAHKLVIHTEKEFAL